MERIWMFTSGIERLARALTSAYAIVVAQAMVRHLLAGWHREYP